MDAIDDFELSRKPSGADPGRPKETEALQTGSHRLFMTIRHHNGQKPESFFPPKARQENRIIIDSTQKNFPSGFKTLNKKNPCIKSVLTLNTDFASWKETPAPGKNHCKK